jgi:epoxyqueuosine reductase QueG
MTSLEIKRKALGFGVDVCGIGDVSSFDGVPLSEDPRQILPGAKCIIGFGFRVPRLLYENMNRGLSFYNYTNMGVKVIDEEAMQMLLMKMAIAIEDEGYDACLQRSVPNLRRKGDKTQNPEVPDTVELAHARAVDVHKAPPDVILAFEKCAEVCGIGQKGLSGHILSDKLGPYIRYCFIITNLPLEPDPPVKGTICDHCGACAAACPGGAIDPKTGLDSWQCSVYYRGAARSNPLISNGFLSNNPEREAILRGEKKFDHDSARNIYPLLDFLPVKANKYVPCLCGKSCDLACYRHLIKSGKIKMGQP